MRFWDEVDEAIKKVRQGPPILIVIQYVYCVFALQFFRQIHQLAQPMIQTGLGHGRVKFLRQL